MKEKGKTGRRKRGLENRERRKNGCGYGIFVT